MTATQLTALYHQASSERPDILGLPGGELSPEEAAGDLVRCYGLVDARNQARERVGDFPAPWNYHFRVYQILCEANDD